MASTAPRHTTLMAALVAAATLSVVLSGCAAANSEGTSKASPHSSTSKAITPKGDSSSPAPKSAPFTLGKTATTAGQDPETGIDPRGTLELTPTDVAYVASGDQVKAANGLFVSVAVKERATEAKTEEADGTAGNGWSWLAPDGQALETGNGSMVAPDGYASVSDAIAEGTYVWHAITFDIPESAKGGTLLYEDASGATYRWKMPTNDSGPTVSKLSQAVTSAVSP